MPRRMFHKEPHPSLDALLASASKHVMTPAQRQAQRRSFEIGQLMIEHPEFSREKAAEIVDSVFEKGRV